jgi:hypothetical protein
MSIEYQIKNSQDWNKRLTLIEFNSVSSDFDPTNKNMLNE